MNSLILRTATRMILPLLLVFSVVLLVRGHNVPGGGFVGGLVAASAFALHGIAFGTGATRELLRVDVRFLIGSGLAVALFSGVFALFVNEPFMQAQWVSYDFSGVGLQEPIKVGTPVLFDIGVYLAVVGVVLTMVFSLAEAPE